MSTSTIDPVSASQPLRSVDGAWQPASPWVTAGVCRLGELLVTRGLAAANPASNAGTSYDNGVFVLAPGHFDFGDLQVRWGRHAGSASVQNREVGRDEWAAILDRARASLAVGRVA